MANPNYIPAKEADFAVWADNFATLLSAAPATYGLTTGDATNVSSNNDLYQAAYLVAANPSTATRPAIAQRAQYRAILTAIVRPLAVLISQNAAVDPEDKLAIGVTLRTGSRTPVVAPSTAPTLDIDMVNIGTVTLRYGNAETPNSKASPRGCAGVEVWAVYNPTADSTPSEGVLVTVATKSPSLISTAGQNATPVRYWARWRTRNGIQGGQVGFSPYSAPVNAVTQ